MTDRHRLRRAVLIPALFVATLWGIGALAAISGVSLQPFAVHPQTVTGLPGVVTAPLVHSGFEHLFANTPPLLLLGAAMLYGFPRATPVAIAMIWLGAGLSVWVFGRPVYHLGASGLTYGMMFFVFVMGILRRDRPSMALSMAAFFLYGGMVWGVFPGRPGISFESHLFGALFGVAAAFLLRHRDPLVRRRVYDWERNPSLGENDPVIGDLWKGGDEPLGHERPPEHRLRAVLPEEDEHHRGQ